MDSTNNNDSSIALPWKPLIRFEWIALVVMLLTVLIAAIPRQNPGICFDDAGDLQFASTLLGIMHPPGYAGYASLGYLITRVPGVDPAYLITLACLCAGLVMLWYCFAFQIRLGVHPWIAAIACLIFTAHRRTWINLLSPEVYVLSMMFLAASAYMMLKYHHLGRRRDFFISAILYGFVLANRPPVLFALPFFIIVWWMARKRWEPSFRNYSITFLIGTMVIAMPIAYSMIYFWFRDTPGTACNYLQQHNDCFQVVPDSQQGVQAKIERIAWLVSAKQFSGKFGTSWHVLRTKLRWLKNDLLAGNPGALILIVMLSMVGAVVAYQRNTAVLWLILGTGLSSLVFVCLYRIHGLAADTLPLLFAMTVLSGVACSTILSMAKKKYQCILLTALATAFGYSVIRDAPANRHSVKSADAIPFLQKVDLDTMPQNALICTGWRSAVPLWYAQHVLTPRPDVKIVAGDVSAWIYIMQKNPNRPAYVTGIPLPMKNHEATPFRNLWKIKLNPDIKN